MISHELLTPEEFAEKLKISRSTLFEWLNKGILLPGKHYFKVGRVLRFVWSEDLILSLLERSVTIAIEGDSTPSGMIPKKSIKPGNKQKLSVNWEY